MTDGIIQKVFDKYYRQLEFHKRLSLDVKDFKTIEQELIEEIEKVNRGKWPSHTPKLILEHELIGDNQE